MDQWSRDRYRRRDQTLKFRGKSPGEGHEPKAPITSKPFLDPWKRGGLANMVHVRSDVRIEDEEFLPILDLLVVENYDDDPPSFLDMFGEKTPLPSIDPMFEAFYVDPDDAPYDPDWWDDGDAGILAYPSDPSWWG